MVETLDCGSRGKIGEVLEMGYGVVELESNGKHDLGSNLGKGSRAEIDTSAPFVSVKKAICRFGGIGYWKPSNAKLPPQHEVQHAMEEVDITKLEEQAVQLKKDLFVKERDTLDVLKDLQKTKMVMEELKQKLQKETSEVNVSLEGNGGERNHGTFVKCVSSVPCSAPGLILMELKQAKLNLSRTTNDLAHIRASVDLYNKKLEKERSGLKKTRERLTQNSSKISCLEEEQNHTKLKLKLVRGGMDNPSDISKELRRRSYEVQQFRKMGEAARSEVLKATQEIEQTKPKIRTAEIRARAARAAEAVVLAGIKAISNSNHNGRSRDFSENQGVTLSLEEYSSLIRKAQEAEKVSKKRVVDAMHQVDRANVSRIEVLKKVEEATEEVKTSKKALEEAFCRVEAAKKGKLAVEEALRRWGSEHGHRRRSIHNTAKFKNSYPSLQRRDSHLLDVNGMNMVTNGSTTVKPKMQFDEENGHQHFSAKRKKFGFAWFSLSTKQSKRKKTALDNVQIFFSNIVLNTYFSYF
ncbi:hypothetical protein UlMin_000833 [Ulmus minor]